MKRSILVALLFVLSAGHVSADYILVKINVNKLNFFPTPPTGFMGGQGGAGMAGGMGGDAGGGGGQIPGGGQLPGGGFGGGQPGDPNMPPTAMDDPDAKWITTFVELRGKPKMVFGSAEVGVIYQIDHKWGTKNWMSVSPMFPITYGNYISQEPFSKSFDAKFSQAKKEKTKSIENLLHAARFALSRGQLKEFHRAMKEAAEADAKHPVVKSYQKVQKDLSKPFNEVDPTQTELIRELQSEKFEPYLSEQKHYCLYAHFFKTDRHTEAAVKRRLAMMEDTLETFYYWFAVQKTEAGQPAPMQPNMPKYRLMAVLANGKEEFLNRHEEWGSLPMVGDGFTPRRDNFMVLSSKSRIADPVFSEFDKVLTERIQEANVSLQPLRISISREDLLTGKINENKTAGNAAIFIGAAQTSVVVAKTLEDDAERGTLTNEAIRQLLIASDMFPRNVQVPDWMIEGLAAFFETSPGSLYPTIGRPSWQHLVSFKHFTKGMQKEAPDLLFNIVTDRYFRDARKLSAELNENRDDDNLRLADAEAWEMARSTSWSFIYYLAQIGKLDMLFQYGKELNALPRDMDLGDSVLQGSFARAFSMTDPKNPRRIAQKPLSNMAVNWFTEMDKTNLDILAAQSYLLAERTKRESATRADSSTSASPSKNNGPKGKSGANPFPNPGGRPDPGPGPKSPPPPMPNPNPPPAPNPDPPPPPSAGPTNLAGSRWSGSEDLKGFGKLSFQFGAGAQVTMFDVEGVTPGNFTLNGNSVTLQFPGGVSYTGTVDGTTMSGTATNGANNWTWTTSNPNGGAPPAKKGPPAKLPFPKKKGPPA